MTSANFLTLEIELPPVLNPVSIADLIQKITILDSSPRFVIIKGSGPVFCNGLDLSWISKNNTEDCLPAMQEFCRLLKLLQTGSFISIAVVSGSVAGGGMGIISACDYVLADETSSFSLPEGLLGLIPGMILPTLLNKLSLQKIKTMFFTGQKYSGEKALNWGLVDEYLPQTELDIGLGKALNSMKSCRKEAVGDFKNLLYKTQIQKDELAQIGIQLLANKIAEPAVSERLINIAEFLES